MDISKYLEQLYDLIFPNRDGRDIAFENTFHNLKFSMLTRQTNDVISKDGSTYYLDELTGQIYSWNPWNQHNWILNDMDNSRFILEHIKFNRNYNLYPEKSKPDIECLYSPKSWSEPDIINNLRL